MYIKSVIIEGFKSYGKRTEIKDFDSEFTAITGLNGTGKSNILDSICFVLGISNLGQVRAASQTDLIYKSGQAGVTRATVTLIFDNSNRSQCPLGYEKCQEISITRQICMSKKNKYLINGKVVQVKKVTDLFCSVQLNVNNPNFLIMQGRITKVLNMKPQEILSMIEEAAGVSLYEKKSEQTKQLLEKKEQKVRETDTLLHEEVEPKLEKLRKEHADYMEFQNINRQIDYLTRIHISYRYTNTKNRIEEVARETEQFKNDINAAHDKIASNKSESERIDVLVSEIQKKLDNETDGELKQFEKELAERGKEENAIAGEYKLAKNKLEQQKKNIGSLEKNIKSEENLLQQKQAESAKVNDMFESLRKADQDDAAAYEKAQKKFEAVTTGKTTNEDGEASSLQTQLIQAKEQLSESDRTLKNSNKELQFSRNELRKRECETQTNDEAYEKDKKLHDSMEAEIKKLQQQLARFNYEDGHCERLEERRMLIQRELREHQSHLQARDAHAYDLQYKDPRPNFDRRKVRGMVGKLFEVRDNTNCQALTTTAGGNLYSFVVDDDVTGKDILQRGGLAKRVTMMPINKIAARPIAQETVRFAQSLVGAENVQLAQSLIKYDAYYENIMQYVFGNTLVCRDLNIAKKVTYHPKIRCRSVTLDGDVMDPEGTLSGGSTLKGQNILLKLQELQQLEQQVTDRKMQLQQIDAELHGLQDVVRKYNHLKQNLNLRQCELDACKQRLAQTTFQQHQEEIKELKERILTLEQDLKKAQEVKTAAQAKIKDINEKLSDSEGYKKRLLKEAGDEMKAAKIKAEASNKNWKKHESNYEKLKLEIENLKENLEKCCKERDELVSSLTETAAEVEKLAKVSESKQQQVNEIKSRVKEKKDHINLQNRELRQMQHKKDKLKQESAELELTIKTRENQISKATSQSKEERKYVEKLLEKYNWIREDEKFFGIQNTRYDYSQQDPEEAGRKRGELLKKKEQMERTINLKAMMLLDHQNEQYRHTMHRKKIVEEDKEKIVQIMRNMDERVRERVDNAWQAVNENFSSIFSTLLAGANACLKPVKTGNTLVGVEIKVSFNNVWKESLNELSGGQRSLIALSLVLAMLKFSPAPVYILDEVDAALDMSHTQNIGFMLKKHFTASQFIVVSLKDGMFNNANVLFRTKFAEGVSCVDRTVNTKNARK